MDFLGSFRRWFLSLSGIARSIRCRLGVPVCLRLYLNMLERGLRGATGATGMMLCIGMETAIVVAGTGRSRHYSALSAYCVVIAPNKITFANVLKQRTSVAYSFPLSSSNSDWPERWSLGWACKHNMRYTLLRGVGRTKEWDISRGRQA